MGDPADPSDPAELPRQAFTRLGEGATLGGFIIEAQIGVGGMGVVYRARQLRPARTVALKVIRPELAADQSFRKRFEDESNHVASIEHSNVIPIYAVGDEGGLVYLAMRFVDQDLSRAISLAGRLDPPRAVGIVFQLCSALDAAHAVGLVHRDVKPGNVLLTTEGGRELALLTDFGLAKSVASTVVDGLFEGTFDYAAPEQIRGQPIDGRTDVYAAGGVLYTALTGQVPFPRDIPAAKAFAHVQAPPPQARALDPNLPPALDAVIARAMAKDPAHRFQSAGDLGRAAAAALHGRPMPADHGSVARGAATKVAQRPPGPPPPPPTPPTPPQRRRTGLVVLAVVLAVALLAGAAGGAYAIFGGGKDTKKQTPAELLAACMKAHGLVTSNAKRAPRAGESQVSRPAATSFFEQTAFVTCSAPPALGANPDGYRSIPVTLVQGPGKSEAEGRTIEARIEPPCETVRISTSFGFMGSFRRLAPFTASRGDILVEGNAAAAGPPFVPATSADTQGLLSYPGSDEIVLLDNNRIVIDDIVCLA